MRFYGSCRESGQWTKVGSWWDRKGENKIDLVAVNRQDKRLLIAEVKTDPEKYDSGKSGLKAVRKNILKSI